MFKFIRKNRLAFRILAVIVFGVGAYINLNDYFTEGFDTVKERNMKLFGAIVQGVMAIIFLVELIQLIKERRQIKA